MKSTTRNYACFIGAAVLAATLGCATTTRQEASQAKQETAGEFFDDATITTKVKTALVGDPATKASEIKVETFKGVVQLSGFVDSPAMADKAVDLAKSVKGVKSVKNDTRARQ